MVGHWHRKGMWMLRLNNNSDNNTNKNTNNNNNNNTNRDREGYVPAEYVRYMEQAAIDQYQDTWQPQGFETYYQNVLTQEHHLPFFIKLKQAVRDVLIPCPCSKYGYVMSRSDLRSGAILSLVFALIVSLVDAFSLIAPCITFDSSKTLVS